MRVLNTLLLVACFGAVGFAQEASTQKPAPPVQAVQPAPAMPSAQALSLETDPRQVRDQFEALLSKYPPEVGRILKMDPTMLSNGAYLQQYPALQQFLAAHPEIARTPSFYLDFVRQSVDYTRPTDPRSRALEIWNDTIEWFAAFAIVAFVSGVVAWLVKTVLNHRRWVRVANVQNEVHNKLLDRFAGTNELLLYVQSPAGRRFLEAAPIPVEAPQDRQIAAPLNRILWSVQAGIILVIGGFGFQYVSGRVSEEIAQGMWTMGVLATAFGLGFIVAGAFSYVISRRLRLFDPPVIVERSDTPAL